MKQSILVIALFTVSISAIGCGSSNKLPLSDKAMANVSDDYDPVSAVLGTNPALDTDAVDDTGEEIAAIETPLAADEDMIGGEMGVFMPTVTVDGKSVAATYTVKTANSEQAVVASDVKAGTELSIQPGFYDVVFTTDKVAGKPPLELRNIEIVKGRRLKRVVKFPVGQITLLTSEKGCASAKIRIKRAGDENWLPGNYTTCKPIFLMAGEYVADKGGTEITGIIVYDGGTRSIVIRQK